MDDNDYEMLSKLLLKQDLQKELLTSLKKKKYETFKKTLGLPAVDPNFCYTEEKYANVSKTSLDTKEKDANVNKTCLDIACSNDGYHEYVELLLHHEKIDVNKVNDTRHKAPIHFAAELGDVETMKKLLSHEKIKIDLLSVSNNALHLTIKKFIQAKKQKDQESMLKYENIIELLLDNGSDPNIIDMKNCTPIHTAAKNQLENILKIILEKTKEIALDIFEDSDGKTARISIEENFPDLISFYKNEVVQSGGKYIKLEFISHLNSGNEKRFLELFKNIKKEETKTYTLSLLGHACSKGFEKIVSNLLEEGADPNTSTDANKPIAVACIWGYYKILQLLIDNKASLDPVNGTSLLQLAIKNKNNIFKQENIDYNKCINILLENKNTDINFLDAKGNTALHYATKLNNQKTVTALLKKGAYIGAYNIFEDPAIADIRPETLKAFFDECITTNHHRPGEKDYEIIFDYKFLVPPINKVRNDNSCIEVVVLNSKAVEPNGDAVEPNNDAVELNSDAVEPNSDTVEPNSDALETNSDALETNGDAVEPNSDAVEPNGDTVEPNSDALETNSDALETNGDAVEPNSDAVEPNGDAVEPNGDAVETNSKVALETDILLYMSKNQDLKHLLNHPIITSFLYLKWNRINCLLCVNVFFYIVFWIFLVTYIFLFNDFDKSSERSNHLLIIVKIFTFVGLILLFLRETFQCIILPEKYVKSPENLLEIILVIIIAIMLIFDCGNFTKLLSAVTILLSSVEFIILFAHFPVFSTNILMFNTVCLNFFKLLCWYFFIIISFALSFYILFRSTNDDSEKNIETTTQTITDNQKEEETDFFQDVRMSLFKTLVMLTGEFDASSINFKSSPIGSHIIFIIFVFMIPIVLLNLLNGLAVSDTQAIKSEAELVGHIKRIQFLSYYEEIFILKTFFEKNAVVNFISNLKWNCDIPKFNLIKLIAKRICLFPDYLPQSKIGVKVNESKTIYYYTNNSKKILESDKICHLTLCCFSIPCNVLSMDGSIIKAAKNVINKTKKREQKKEEKLENEVDIKEIQSQLNIIAKSQNELKTTLQQLMEKIK